MWSANGDDNRFHPRRMVARASEMFDRKPSDERATRKREPRTGFGRQEEHDTHVVRAGRSVGTDASEAMEAPSSFMGKGPKGWIRSDEHIADEVNASLARHEAVDASDLEINVVGGVVTLRGTVADTRQKRLAESVVECVSGVRDVQSEIQVPDINLAPTSNT